MTFANPIFLYAAAITAIAATVLFVLIQKRKRAILENFVSKSMVGKLSGNLSRFKLRFKAAIFVLGLAFVFIALARPQYGFVWEEEKSVGLDIIFAVDTSKSMLAEDLKPNRLERSKLAISDLVDRLEGDRVGLVAFSGQAFLQCPMTLDYGAFRLSLEALDTDIIQRGGTNISAAISESAAAFGDSKNQKILILISDGEELEASGLNQAKKAHKDNGIKIYTLGVGGVEGGPIPVRDSYGKLNYLRDSEGNLVTSRLNEELLSQIAQATGGFYASLAEDGMILIYEDGIRRNEKSEFGSKIKKLPIERFQIPLAIAIALLALESIIGTRRLFGRKSANLLVALFMLGLFTAPHKTHAAQTPDPQTFFNKGIDAFDSKDYAKAKEDFYRAIAQSRNLRLHADAFYNAGAADYELAKANTEALASVAELKGKAQSDLQKALQNIIKGNEVLTYGNNILKAKGEGGLKKPEVQNQVKQAISAGESSKKIIADNEKPIREAASSLEKISAVNENARNNFANALELSPTLDKARRALDASNNAKEKIMGISNELSEIQKANKENAKSLETLIGELKKLLREDENQQQNQEQQGQDQSRQDSQDNKNQDSQDKQKENSQENEDKPQQNKEDQNSQRQDSNKDKADNEKKNDKAESDDAKKEDKANESDASKEEAKQEEQAVENKPETPNEENRQESADSQNAQDQMQENAAPSEEEAIEQGREDFKQNAAQTRDAQAQQDDQDFRAAAGAMTRREAAQILDSLKDSEKKLPFSGYGDQKRRYDDNNYKDW